MVDDQDVEVKDVPVLEGFTTKTKEELDSLRQTLGLAMSQADIEHVQRYFEKERFFHTDSFFKSSSMSNSKFSSSSIVSV